MVRYYHQLNEREFEQTLGDGGGQRILACYSSWGHTVSDLMTNRQKQQTQMRTTLPPEANWALPLSWL